MNTLRAAALAQLADFLPHAARYASQRNFDLGPGNHSAVSRLSPYLRTRLLTEEEVTRAVLTRHSPRAAEKFLQEVAWRTYWKGWLEMRPNVWTHYRQSLAALEITPACQTALDGRTGIECFDHWHHELTTTGYLHNHARMWFASIWIFTLKLPWQLGADFFLRHLLDADPAANTLSWRWVAGLHTVGKHYLARAENIKTYTQGRFNPIGQLDESAPPLPLDQTFEKQPLLLPPNPTPTGRVGHLMFPDDLAPAPSDLGPIHATAAFLPPSFETTPLVADFLNSAIDSTLATRHGHRLTGDLSTAITTWAEAEKLDTIVLSRPTIGPLHDLLATSTLPPITRIFIRHWDRQLWPHATAGFFKLKAALPKLHASLTPELPEP